MGLPNDVMTFMQHLNLRIGGKMCIYFFRNLIFYFL